MLPWCSGARTLAKRGRRRCRPWCWSEGAQWCGRHTWCLTTVLTICGCGHTVLLLRLMARSTLWVGATQLAQLQRQLLIGRRSRQQWGSGIMQPGCTTRTHAPGASRWFEHCGLQSWACLPTCTSAPRTTHHELSSGLVARSLGASHQLDEQAPMCVVDGGVVVDGHGSSHTRVVLHN